MPQNTKKKDVQRKKPKPRGKSASVMINYIRKDFFNFTHLPAKGGRAPVKVPKAAKKR